MGKGRLEAFSDGVIAILITIMVFDVKAPGGGDLSALVPVVPLLLTYALSFLYLGIYWNNHHHMLHATRRVDGLVLWANLHLLFWLSLFPFTTNWLRSSDFSSLATAVYGFVLFLAAISYTLLQAAIIRVEGSDSILRRAVGHDGKGKASLFFYLVGIAASFARPSYAMACYVGVALIWLVPDRRIETTLNAHQQP